MSETSVKARAAMKAKAERLGSSGDPHERVDASSWTPPAPMNTEAPTGPRPVSKRRNYKRGGHVEGVTSMKRADRKARKGGGKALVNDLVNYDVKEANEERPGIKHEGGMKRGGRARRNMGGGLGVMGGLIPLAIEALDNRTSGAAPYAPGTPGQPAPGRKDGGRAHRDMGGPLAGALSQGIGGQGRLSFNYPAARSAAQSLGLKTGGKVHPKGCMCDRCKGGRVERARGGGATYKGQFSNEDGGRQPRKGGGKLDTKERDDLPKREFGEPGSRKYPMPDKSHAANAKARASEQEHKGKLSKSAEEKIDAKADRVLARKNGGSAGKGKMSVNIVIAPGHAQPPAAPMMGPPPGAGPVPVAPKVVAPPPQMGPPPGMPPGMPPMGPGGPPPMMPRKRGGLVDGGAGGGLGRLEKIEDYGHRAREAESRR